VVQKYLGAAQKTVVQAGMVYVDAISHTHAGEN